MLVRAVDEILGTHSSPAPVPALTQEVFADGHMPGLPCYL